MKRSHWFFAGFLASIALAVVAQQTGYPTRIRALSIGINVAPPSGAGRFEVNGEVTLDPSGGTDELFVANNQVLAQANTALDAGGGNDEISVTTGAVAVLGNLTDDGVSLNAASGTFTASYDDACTTTPTQDWDYQQVGNLVILSMRAAPAACTGDSLSFQTTGAPVPAALRPSGTSSGLIQSGLCNNFTDNSTGAAAWAQVSETGNIAFTRATVSGANILPNTWTAALNRQPGRDCQVAYMLGNP